MSAGALCIICGHHFDGDPCYDCECPGDKTGRGLTAGITRSAPDRRAAYEDVLETMHRVHDPANPDGHGTVKCARCLGTVRYEKRMEKRTRRGRARKQDGKIWSRGKCEMEGCLSWII
jgi:hypothetical protein